MNAVLVYLLAYIGLLFMVSWYVARRQLREDFLIAGRNRPGWQVLLSKFAASIGAGYFITYTAFAYEYGVGVFALLAGLIVGFLLFAYWAAPRIARHAREGRFYTVGHFVRHATGSGGAALLADVVASGIMFGWLLVGIVGSGKIIADLGLLSYAAAVVITSSVVVGYLFLAGFRAVVLTDIIQSAIIFILMVVVTVGIVGTGNLLELHTISSGNVDLGTMIGLLLFGMLSVFSYSDRYQLSYAARSERALKHGLGMAVAPILGIAYLLLLIGVFMAKHVTGLDPGLVFTEALRTFLSPELLPLAIVLFFAGIMSSADTNVYAISSHYALHRRRKDPNSVRKSIIVVAAVVTALALVFPHIVEISILVGGASLLLSWPMIYIIAGGKNAQRFFGSVTLSVVGFIVGLSYFGIQPVAALPIIVFGGLGLLYGKRGISNR